MDNAVAALNTAVLLPGPAEERHHGVSSLRHGPSGLRERVKLGLHGSAQHRARRHHQLRHGGQLPPDVAHRRQVHRHPEEVATFGSGQPRRGHVLQSPVAQQLRLLLRRPGGRGASGGRTSSGKTTAKRASASGHMEASDSKQVEQKQPDVPRPNRARMRAKHGRRRFPRVPRGASAVHRNGLREAPDPRSPPRSEGRRGAEENGGGRRSRRAAG